MRCPSCSARNTEDAAWCTQCYTRFTDPAPDAGAGGSAPMTSADAHADRPNGPPAAPVPTSDAEAAPQRDVRLRDEVVEWRCGACDTWTPLTATACATCASPRSGFGPTDRRDPARAPAVALSTAMAAGALLPGLGHLLTGAVGTGLSRGLLWLLWAGGGVAMTLSAGLSPGSAVLLLAALALWTVSLVDLQRQAAGRPPVADGRVLAWSVVGVTLLLVGAVLAGTVGQQTG